MPLAPEEKPGRSFATDMRLIREQRGLSPQDIYRATKLPIEIVTLFEQTGLVNHPRYNRVYLRSFVREYARVVGIREGDALEALDAALNGQYHGTLAVIYLGVERGEFASIAPPVPAPPAGRADPSNSAARGDLRLPEISKADESSRTGPPIPPSPSLRPRKRVRQVSNGLPIGRWVGIFASLLALGAAIAAVVYLYTMPVSPPAPARQEEAPLTSPVDSARQVEPRAARPVIGEPMQVSVIAQGGKLEPIRKQADGGLETPHWVEEGDTLRFSAVDGFSLIGSIGRIELLVDGHSVPTDQRTAEGRLVLSREDIVRILQANHDTLR